MAPPTDQHALAAAHHELLACVHAALAKDGAGAPPCISSSELLLQHQELRIRHAEQTYRLRLTRLNKLILTK